MRSPLLLPALVLLAALPACEQKKPAPPPSAAVAPQPAVVTFPDLGEGKVKKDGVRVHKLTVDRGGVPMKIWVYQPKDAKPGEKRPCVFIAPAGTPMMIGMDLADEDSAEHFPYARRGYTVVAYSLDGHVPKNQMNNDAALMAGVRAYRNASGGMANAQTAIDFAMAKLNPDPDRLATAGHSSAATQSLMVARKDRRIKACIAYAPCLDVVGWLRDNMAWLESGSPGFEMFIRTTSPAEFPGEPACPTFLFHAKDDTVVKYAATASFAASLAKENPKTKFVTANRGGHFQSMIDAGIPAAITWLDEVFAKK